MTERRLRRQPALPRSSPPRRSACSAGSGSGGSSRACSALATRDRRAALARGLAATAAASACSAVAALSPVISDKVDNIDVTLDVLRYEASLWDTLPGMVDEAGGTGPAAGLRQRLQRAVPDPDGRLRARHPRHRRARARHQARARRGVPHEDAPDQPDRAQADRRPHAAGGRQPALAARRPPRAPTPADARAPPAVPTRRASPPRAATPELRSSR